MKRLRGGQKIDKVIKIEELPNGDKLGNTYYWMDLFKLANTSGVSQRFKRFNLLKYGQKLGDGHKYWSINLVLKTIFGSETIKKEI